MRGPTNFAVAKLLAGAALVYAMAIVADIAPNPVERFVEVDASMYHNMSAILDASGSSFPREELARSAREVLEREGRISMHDMRAIWPHYISALPGGITLPVPGAASREIERRALSERVGARLSAEH